MLKKISAVVATAAMMLVGLTVMPASATTYTPNADSGVNKINRDGDIPNNGQVTVAGANSRLTLNTRWGFSGTALDDVMGDQFSFDWSLTKPDNTVVTSANSMQNNMYVYASAGLSGNGNYYNIDAPSGTTFDMAGRQGETYTQANVNFDLFVYNYSSQGLPTGTYTLALTLKVNGVEYTNFTTMGSNNAYVESKRYYQEAIPTPGLAANIDFGGRTSINVSSITCIDTAQVTVGDVLTVRTIVDGNPILLDRSGVDSSVNTELANKQYQYVNQSRDRKSVV
jgi:hypothetical protein